MPKKRGRAPGKRLTDAEAEVVADFVYDYEVQISPTATRTSVEAVSRELGYDGRNQLSGFINGSRGMDRKRWERLLVLIARSDEIFWRRLADAATSETAREMALAGLVLYADTPAAGRGRAYAAAL